MRLGHFKAQSVLLTSLITIATLVLLVPVFCALEYLCAKHYFTIRYYWYQLTSPWNGIHFAFYQYRFPDPESTLLVSSLTGVIGAMVLWVMNRLAYSRSIALSLVCAFLITNIASRLAFSATFAELLSIAFSQSCVLIAASMFFPKRVLARSQPDSAKLKGSFTLLDLFLLIAIISCFMLVITPGQTNRTRYINLWLPLLGASNGIVSLQFLSTYQSKNRLRFVFMAVWLAAACGLGYGLALAYNKFKILHGFYTFSPIPIGSNNFMIPGYVAWLALTGIFSIVACKIIDWLPWLARPFVGLVPAEAATKSLARFASRRPNRFTCVRSRGDAGDAPGYDE